MYSKTRATPYSTKYRKAPQPPPRGHTSKSKLSIVAQFDELVRNGNVLNGGCEKEFLIFASSSDVWIKRCKEAERSKEQMNVLLKEREKEIATQELKMKQAQNMLDEAKRGKRLAETERDDFAKKLDMLKEIIESKGDRAIDNETLERVRHINTTTRNMSPCKNELRLPVVEESMESILDVSDFSFDETRDDINGSYMANKSQSRYKKRKSRSFGTVLDNDKILSTTTKVTVDARGNAHAESYIEAMPADIRKKARKSRESMGEKRVKYNDENVMEFSPSAPPLSHMEPYRKSSFNSPSTYTPQVKRHISNASSMPNRPHRWESKKGVSSKCGVCERRFAFGKEYFRCKDCLVVCHEKCKTQVPLPCVAAALKTNNSKGHVKVLADYIPPEPPFIPAILRVCLPEVESRGLEETGIYRVPGNECDANAIVQKFLRGKGVPNLSKYGIHEITSSVKKFFRSLKEPIIPSSQWKLFVDASSNVDHDSYNEGNLYQAISELPRPNRETLAFLILHLQTVAESPLCKMDIDNLSVVWGPTIVGHSSANLGVQASLHEVPLQKAVVKCLLNISRDYWGRFLKVDNDQRFFPNYYTPEDHGEKPTFFTTGLKTGPIARRTRSHSRNIRHQFFQSPMLK